MTQTQKSMLDKALTRAIAQDINIIGKGTIKATGTVCWFVTSGKGDGSSYMVAQVSSVELTCTCKAGQRGQHCKHRALVTARMMADAKAVKVAALIGARNPRCYR